MSKKWLLDVRIRGSKTLLVVYDEEKDSIDEKEFNTHFYGYITSSEAQAIARELDTVNDIDEVFIEKWRKPPYYDELVDVVVFKTRNYRVLLDVLNKSIWKNIEVVNTFPHPLVESMYRTGLKPLTRIKSISEDKIVLYPWKPVDKDPAINYVSIDLENGYYVVETSSEKQFFQSIEEVVDYITSTKAYIGLTNPYIYTKLVEIDSRVRDKIYMWITSGCFKPVEYFEWSRLSYIPLSLMNNVTIGRILSTIEALRARDRKYLVQKTRRRVEKWRTIRELILNDRGGVVYQPKPGLYWSVCQIDFKSLYPSIIVKYNVSGETVDKTNCVNKLTLPWTNHTICLDAKGVVPESIEKLIELKETYDKLYRETGDEIYEYRKSAVKWILVASFGYLGYRNSLFGSVMAHEVVTSTSRELLRKTRVVVEKQGYRVIHTIVDSIFIECVDSIEECNHIKEKIIEETGFEAKVEAHYVWLYIPRVTRGSSGVSNKYYGLLSDNSVKVKGIMCVRRDTPLFVKKAQIEALSELFKARSLQEFLSRLMSASRVIDHYIERLVNRDFDYRELIISRNTSVRNNYRKPPSYVESSNPPYRLIYVNNKLIPVEKWSRTLEVDIDKYIELLEKARRELPSIGEVTKL